MRNQPLNIFGSEKFKREFLLYKNSFFVILLLFIIPLQLFAQEEASSADSFREDFASDSLINFHYGSRGTKASFKWHSGVASATDQGTNILSFKIDPADSAGAGRGPEIISNEFTHFGTYSARLKIPDVRKVQPNTGAVIGYFTYNVDSIPGLSEIDFEWLVADPEIIYIGTWTGQRGTLQRIGRTLNLATGMIYNTISKVNHNGIPTDLKGGQNEPENIQPLKGYDASARFYTYGFDWLPDRLTWWIINPETNKKMILWDYHGSTLGIPQNHSLYRMNFWYTKDWAVQTNPNSKEQPKNPYELEVDWMSYQPLK